MPSETIIGIDVGTTAVKFSCFTLSGTPVFKANKAYPPIAQSRPGWAEQDPDVWLSLIRRMAESAATFLNDADVVAVGVTSQVNTHVFVDEDGVALIPAISWQDQRCADTADALDSCIDANMREALWGEEFKLDATNLLSRAQWVKEHRPEVWSKTRWILSPKDYCLLHLTGEPVSDPVSSIGLVDSDGNYLDEAFSLVDGVAGKLPPLRNPMDRAGKTRPSFNWPNVPVSVGVMDAWASLFGSGAAHNGHAFQVSGTSEIIGAVSNEHRSAEGVVTFPPIPGWFLHAGPTQLGGDALNWLSSFLGIGITDVLDSAAAARNSVQPMLFLPHVMGERAPLWDAKAKGVFAGISSRHNRNDLAYSVLEGVAHAARLLLTRIEQAAGFEIPSLRLSGGGARSDLWCQIKSNVMNRRLERLQHLDTGTLGAALIAAVAQGIYADIDAAAESAVKVGTVFEPQADHRERCDDMHKAYIACYEALRPINHALHDMAEERAS